MKFTFSWLKEYLNTTKTVEEIESALVSLGLEVEDVIDPLKKLKGFVIADVVECGRHPDADRLSLCKIDDGSGEILQVVCGAPNVRQGLKIAFARVGCLIPSTNDVLKKGKIRGIESQGMICSKAELCLGEDSEGIMELNTDLKAGSDLALVFSDMDVTFDISITPNRADCFSVRGIARDLAAFGMGDFIDQQSSLEINCSQKIDLRIENFDACPYFSMLEISNIKNVESPLWLKKRIEAIGQKPISALVDITNYVLFDCGQPFHVFDADKIDLPFRVRNANDGEEATLLDEVCHKFNPSDLIISDQKEVHSLAGIKGGFESRSLLETNRIYLEAAVFNPISIALSGQKHNLFSDARARFERGTDPQNIRNAMKKAAGLILEICGGKITGYSEQGEIPNTSKKITLTKEYLERKTGQVFDVNKVNDIFKKLGFKENFEKDTWHVITPSWRHDMTIPENLVEEVLRLNGYDNIPSTPLPIVLQSSKTSLLDKSKNALLNNGLNEVITFSMVNAKTANLFKQSNDVIEFENPLNSELSHLRPSILPSLLHVAMQNKAKSLHNTAIFEAAPTFFKKGDHFNQSIHISGLRFDKNHDDHWLSKSRNVDVYDVKADILSVLTAYTISESSIQIDTETPSYYHPKRSARVKQGNKVLGYFGQLHPLVLKHFNCSNTVVAFEVDTKNLPGLIKSKIPTYNPSVYQPIYRDLAFITSKDLSADMLLKTIKKIDPLLIQDSVIFDVFTDEKIGTDKKSIAVRLKVQAQDRTLTDVEMMTLQNNIIVACEKIGAHIRDGQ